MKLILLATALAVTAYAAPTDEWNQYKAEYKKVYTSETENMRRLKEYLKTKEMVEEHNRKYDRGETTYTMGINKFADWFPEEFSRLNGLKPRESVASGKPFKLPPVTDIPDSMSWVEKGAVTSVKDQGQCGSCYAFSAVGAIEGLMFTKNGTLQDLSAQELVDCSANSGCNGGNLETSFEYVEANGIQSDKSYPYIAEQKQCRAENRTPVAYMTGSAGIPGEEDMKYALALVSPLSFSFGVDKSFHAYKRGVFDGTCPDYLNHAMLLVGYGVDKKTKREYWLVKNSWGTDWGEKGYIRVIMGKNKCGLSLHCKLPLYDIYNVTAKNVLQRY